MPTHTRVNRITILALTWTSCFLVLPVQNECICGPTSMLDKAVMSVVVAMTPMTGGGKSTYTYENEQSVKREA